jgi:hypothetical protein
MRNFAICVKEISNYAKTKDVFYLHCDYTITIILQKSN